MTNYVVWSEFELMNAINVESAIITLAKDIYLTRSVDVKVPIAIYGNGHKIDGQGTCGCFIVRSSLEMSDVRVVHGNSETMGGGLFVYPHAEVSLVRCFVTLNRAAEGGGGIWNSNGFVEMTDGKLANNKCVEPGCIGGGIFSSSAEAATLTNVRVLHNQATYGGGIAAGDESAKGDARFVYCYG